MFDPYKLKCPEHVADASEERFQDILDYNIVLERISDPQKIPYIRTVNLSQKNHILNAREKSVTTKLWEQEEAITKEEESNKTKREERLEKALELQKLLEEAAEKKKNLVQQQAKEKNPDS